MWESKLEIRRVVRSPVMTFRKDTLAIGPAEGADIPASEAATLRVDDDGVVWVDDRTLAVDEPVTIGTSRLELAAVPVRSPEPHSTWQLELFTTDTALHKQVVIRGTELVVGRIVDADLQLKSEDVAPHHCVVTIADGRIVVKNLDAELGTFVNGVRVDEAVVAAGDEVEVGDFRLRFVEPPRPSDEPVWQITVEVHVQGSVSSLITFRKRTISVGRAADNDIVLHRSRQASKRHCYLQVTDGIVQVQDNDSTNGTYIEGRRVAATSELEPGERLYVGEFVIVLVEPARRAR